MQRGSRGALHFSVERVDAATRLATRGRLPIKEQRPQLGNKLGLGALGLIELIRPTRPVSSVTRVLGRFEPRRPLSIRAQRWPRQLYLGMAVSFPPSAGDLPPPLTPSSEDAASASRI